MEEREEQINEGNEHRLGNGQKEKKTRESGVVREKGKKQKKEAKAGERRKNSK